VDKEERIQEIRESLARIERKLDSDKSQTLVVGIALALITAGAGFISTYVTNKKQESMKAELTQSVEKLGEMGKQVAQKQMEFYTRATALLTDLDDSFNEICYLNPTVNAEQKLTQSLDAYRKLLEQTTEEITDTNLRIQMKSYSDFVLEKFSLIKTAGGKMGEKQKDSYYVESRKLLNSVRTQLNKLLTSGAVSK